MSTSCRVLIDLVTQLTREVDRLGSTVARLKLKGIDGDPHKRWMMWINSMQREKPYLPLTCQEPPRDWRVPEREPEHSLQLDCVKLESLVIADQHAAVNTFPGLVHTARHTMGAGFTRSSRLEHRVDNAGVVGSNPTRPTKDSMRYLAVHEVPRGISSAGRAPALQAGGRRFDPVILHHSTVSTVLI
ncbi:hypothetical protein Lal_00014971 [Lupinus albus]|nr:hypothetical protein Lal_00014971 [Lupinus albus]